MQIVADLHIHSRYSRATARDLDFTRLYRGASEKGIHLMGTGDFTHPCWMREIEELLEYAEDGLFRLRKSTERVVRQNLGLCGSGKVRFVLQVEVCNVYRKDGRVRKNHNLIYVPSIESAKSLSKRLDRVGNLASDGRPVLGLDARDLLEMVLETDPRAFLIPAHIWTPWYSMLGSRSGFDSLEACFGDMAGEIFAVETGLSSDPPMNWRVGSLDGLTLVSNSDAHSASRLGREANLLDIDLSYDSLRHALRSREGFTGTLEFYPEQGKYHFDGHRACGYRSTTERAGEATNCPLCGNPLTIGVASRVCELADYPMGRCPEDSRQFESLVSLEDIVCQAVEKGSASKMVRELVIKALKTIGPELVILRTAPREDIRRVLGERVAEGIHRVRTGQVTIEGGYDGVYGVVKVFE